jgi:hypothetical protein
MRSISVIQLDVDDAVEIDVVDDGEGMMSPTSAAGSATPACSARVARRNSVRAKPCDGKRAVVRAQLPLQSRLPLQESTFST